MPKWTLLMFLGVRVVSVPLVQTWFVPDEYWQATEVAHSMAFRYGYKTWEWQEGIRGVLYPGFLAGLFKLLAFLGADTPMFLIHIPRLLHAIAFAVGDYHIWRLSKALYGNASAWWTAVCLSTTWFLGYCAPRTLTSCVEMVLLAVAFSYYPWQRERDSYRASYLWPVGFACAVRPTAAVPFLPLALRHLLYTSHRCQLLLHYIAIMTTLVAFTVALDSWYYGELVVVAWRFIHFNVVSGLSAHYGTLPWHWYVSQGVPATLTTHLLPLTLALFSQPVRHKNLLLVICWSLVVYSCLGHKEFRFLLPVLPLCLCVAGDQIAFHLTAHAKRSSHPSGLRHIVIFLALLVPNVCALLYLGLVHQRGALDVMQVLRAEIEAHPHSDILFLMPCHSTPYYSHLHKNVTMRFLTCEPNLKGEEDYQDEADLFDKDPLNWIQQEYDNQLSLLPHSTEREEKDMKKEEKELKLLGSGRKREDKRTEREKEETSNGLGNRRKIEGKGTEREKEEEVEADELGNGSKKYDTDRTVIRVNSNSKNSKIEIAVEEGKGTGGRDIGERRGTRGSVEEERGKEIDHRENEENGSKGGERSSIPHSPPHDLPSHIVMFSVLSAKVEEFLSVHHYHLCHQLFHAHINDGRRSTHINIYCRLEHKHKYRTKVHQ